LGWSARRQFALRQSLDGIVVGDRPLAEQAFVGGETPFSGLSSNGGFWCSEIRSRAELDCALLLFLHPSHQRDTVHRPIAQVGYERVVELDIGARESDIWAVRVVTISERAGRTQACSRGLL
jgi:hypothetical protein